MPLLIYHITHLNNLPSIIACGGLISYNKLRQRKANYTDIAHEKIQDRRARKTVPCSVGGVLHDYVPFYFASRSPMLFSIHKGKVEGYQEGQYPIIHLVLDTETIVNNKLAFAFTDGHAIMDFSEFYDDINLLSDVIDWKLMKEKYWNDTNEDNDRKRRRQAEFLIHQFCPWILVQEIGVINHEIKTKVQQILQNQNHQPPVKIYPDWYY